MDFNKYIEKTYCLYASDWHLTIMLLPFISRKLQEKDRIFMKFENSIEDKMKLLTNKLGFKNEDEINEISWGMEINDEEESDDERIYIVAGTKEYMDEMNSMINNYYREKSIKIKIINCFDIMKGEKDEELPNIEVYDSFLTTNGETAVNA